MTALAKALRACASGIPADFRDPLAGLDDRNIQLLVTAIRRAYVEFHEQE